MVSKRVKCDEDMTSENTYVATILQRTSVEVLFGFTISSSETVVLSPVLGVVLENGRRIREEEKSQ